MLPYWPAPISPWEDIILEVRENMADIDNQKIAVFNWKQKAEIYLSQGKLDEAYFTCLKSR